MLSRACIPENNGRDWKQTVLSKNKIFEKRLRMSTINTYLIVLRNKYFGGGVKPRLGNEVTVVQ